jgi:hypothetical protein
VIHGAEAADACQRCFTGLSGHRLEELLALGLLGGSALGLGLGRLGSSSTTTVILELLGIRVELDHGAKVLERVLLDALGGNGGSALLSRNDLGLNLIGVDDAGQVAVRHHGTGDTEALLLSRFRTVLTAVKPIELGQRVLGEDNEASEVTTRGKLKEVEGRHVGHLDTRDVAEGFLDAVVLAVHHKGSTTLHVTAVAHLALARADLTRCLGLLDVVARTEGSEDLHRSDCLVDGLDRVLHDQRALGDLVNLVATSHDQRGKRRRSQGGAHGVPLLVGVDLAVPLPPGLGRVEHAASTAHVAEGSLTSTVGTTTRDTRNAGDGTARSPRLGRGLVPSVLVDGVRLALVLVHGGVHEVDDVRADRRKEHRRELHLLGGVVASGGLDGNDRTGSHLLCDETQLSLNRSQCGSCSTKYDTSAGT